MTCQNLTNGEGEHNEPRNKNQAKAEQETMERLPANGDRHGDIQQSALFHRAHQGRLLREL